MREWLSIFITLSVLLVGCNDNPTPEGKPLEIKLFVGDITASSIELSVMAQGAEQCSYMCVMDASSPSVEEVMADGQPIELDTNGFAMSRVEGLAPDTSYVIYVAATCDNVSAINSLSATTLKAADVEEKLSVSITPGVCTSNSISFTITPTSAERCAYMLFDEEQPDIETIFANGVEVAADASSEIVVENLYSSSCYYVVAAVMSGDDAYSCTPVAMTTLEGEIEYIKLVVDSTAGGEWYDDDNYFLCLKDSDAQMSVELDLYMVYGDGVHLFEGAYLLQDVAEELYIDEQYSRFAEMVDGVERGAKFETAKLEVESAESGYTIRFEGKLFEEERVVIAEYEGVPVGCQ